VDLVVSLLGTVILIAGLGLDLARLRRRDASKSPRGGGGGPGQLEPFRIWVLRVYFFSVLALPFYFWRTRGRARWALVGIGVAVLYLSVLEGAVGLVSGCSAGSPDASAPRSRTGAEASAGDDSAPDGGGRSTAAQRESSAAEVDRALHRLKSARFPDALAAKGALVASASPRAVAGLVALARATDRVVLTDTADLIYPGTRRFHGHGLVVPYDIDRLGARAGWVLEALTFRDFGFSRAPHPDATEPSERPDAATRAAAWWSAQGGRFSRTLALAAALREGRDVRAEAVLEVAAKEPLDDAVRAALPAQIVPALVAGLAADGPGRALACRVARLVVLRHLSRTDARLRGPLDRTLAGDANLVDALRTSLQPELVLEVEVPGAAEILSPAYSIHARDAALELLRRLAYARGDDRIGLAIAPGRIVVYEGDAAREAEAWRSWLR
jgi:hypothetical protein